MGTGEIGIPTLEALVKSADVHISEVITQPDRPVGRHQKLAPSPIKEAAQKNQLRIYQPENVNSPTSLTQIKYHEPDVIVVFAYGQILRKRLLEIPRYGCLNLHASLLPKYRGAACIPAPIRNGDDYSGITLMQMDEGLDTGDVILQKKIKLSSKATAGSLHDCIAAEAPEFLLQGLKQIASGKGSRTKQNDAEATYVKKLSKENGLIDWKLPQIQIDQHIRAMNPWPAAFSLLPGEDDKPKMLKIFETIISNRAKGEPGEVLNIDKHGVLVAAGKGGLLLREVQLEGKKRMHAAEFARGYHLQPGVKLL